MKDIEASHLLVLLGDSACKYLFEIMLHSRTNISSLDQKKFGHKGCFHVYLRPFLLGKEKNQKGKPLIYIFELNGN